MRRGKASLLIGLIVFLSVLLLPRADARIVIGVSTVNVAFLPIYVTQDKGFFKDEGLDALVVMFNAGATNLQALIGGDVQIMAGGVPETVLARASGVDIKNFWAISNLMPFQIYGAPTFKSLKDAKGKKFAISRFGSLSEFLTRSSLRQSGTLYCTGRRHGRCHRAVVPGHRARESDGIHQTLRSEGSLSRLDQRRLHCPRVVVDQGERAGDKIPARLSAWSAAHSGKSRRRHQSAKKVCPARRRGGRRWV